jgi:hypothetical protein
VFLSENYFCFKNFKALKYLLFFSAIKKSLYEFPSLIDFTNSNFYSSNPIISAFLYREFVFEMY